MNRSSGKRTAYVKITQRKIVPRGGKYRKLRKVVIFVKVDRSERVYELRRNRMLMSILARCNLRQARDGDGLIAKIREQW